VLRRGLGGGGWILITYRPGVHIKWGHTGFEQATIRDKTSVELTSQLLVWTFDRLGHSPYLIPSNINERAGA